MDCFALLAMTAEGEACYATPARNTSWTWTMPTGLLPSAPISTITAGFEQRDRERVADRGLHQRRGGRRQIVRTGFARPGQFEHDLRGFAERRGRVRRHRDHRDRKALRIIDEILHFRLLAGPRQRDDDVIRRDHAEIAVARLSGMHEEGGGA